jgi:serine/threonine-protein kinase
VGTPLTRAQALLGAKLGPYEIVRLIGQGGSAAVYEARHIALGKGVALKILHEHLAGEAGVSERFVREARLTAQLRHPHALDVLDVGEDRGVAYLAMELLEGTSLEAHLRSHHTLPLEDALALLFPIAAALAYAHARAIIHRDVKPGNVFLARDARGTIVPKLLDFGLSKALDSEDGAALTSHSLLMGTALYMSPEQTGGARFASAQSDQYSFAVMLYECVTGRTPLHGSDLYEVLERIRTTTPPVPSSVNARLPSAFDAVVMRALEREPSNRHSSVKALAAALLPFASPKVAEAWRRDFVETSSGPLGSSSSASRRISSKSPNATPLPDASPSEPRSSRKRPIARAAVPDEAQLDWLVPFPRPRDQIKDARNFRSTWLTASRATLREMGHFEAYEKQIDPAYRDRLREMVPGVWLPMDVARAHYTAADHLGLPTPTLVEIGMAATKRANATTLSFMTRMAQGAGATPWTLLAQVQRLWSLTADDGAMGVARLGPKEAHFEVQGYPLAGIHYNRVTMRGIATAVVSLFCSKVYVNEIPALCTERSLGMRVSWV